MPNLCAAACSASWVTVASDTPCASEAARHATQLRELLAVHREGRDLVEIGAYKPGTNPRLDVALHLMPALESFLRQQRGEHSRLEETRELMGLIAASAEQRLSGVTR